MRRKTSVAPTLGSIGLFGAGLAAGLCPPAALAEPIHPWPQPTPSGQLFFFVQQDTEASLAPATSSRPELAIFKWPRHGSIEESGGQLTYRPDPGYVGRDSFELTSEESAAVVVEMRVLPRFLPLAGRFYGDEQSAALFDNLRQRLVLCEELADARQPMTCHHHQVDGLEEKTYLPLPWPTKYDRDEPALFDPAAGRLVLLSFDVAGWHAGETFDLPDAVGAWPVFGDWYGSGKRGLALVKENGEVRELGKDWRPWREPLAVPPGDGLVWPIVLPGHGPGDAIALVEPETGHLRWLAPAAESGSITSGVEPCRACSGRDLRLPMSWLMTCAAASLPGPEVFYLQKGAAGLELVPGMYAMGKPSTIPVKFPDDPPGG